ncbi:MAG: glycosyltransferase [Acidobacteria bacterium]|nr:glycosyltransferase [Acidobacteriota bacterium]
MQPESATPLISVIIPTYNSAAFLRQSLDSVLQQTVHDLEVIVVDDGSTDETVSLLDEYQDAIRYLRQDHAGASAARNRGLAEARGEFIAFQDADDLWMPEKLEMQLACFQQQPDSGIVFTDARRFLASGEYQPSFKEQFGNIPTGKIFNDLLASHFIAMSSVMIRKSCFEQVGLFDESLMGSEDYNLYLRLARKFHFTFVDKVLVHIRTHGNSLSDNLAQMCEDEIKNLDKIAALFPDARIPKRQLSGRIYARFGRYYFALLAAVPHSWRTSLLALIRMRKRAS